MNRGLQLCDTIILVPLNFCSFNVSCLFNGLVYYNQWGRLFWWQVVSVLIGITILVWGVLIISIRSTTSSLEMESTSKSLSSPPTAPASALETPHSFIQQATKNDLVRPSQWKHIQRFLTKNYNADEIAPLLPST
jgi:hypothetical protein